MHVSRQPIDIIRDAMSEEANTKLSLQAQIEGLLFVAPGTVSVKHMADALEKKPREIEKAIGLLGEELGGRGIGIQKHNGEYKLVSAPELAEKIEIFLDLSATSRLSTAALECLSIIAYQQAITRPMIDSIRGVNSDGVLRTLLSNGLVEEAGRAEGPGRPILYVTSPDFLQHFGLSSLEELPPLQLEQQLEKLEAAENGENGNGKEILKD